MDVTTAPCAPTPSFPYRLVIFDLDGTLVDPAGGITGGIAHALRTLNLPVPADAALAAMVGPKLADALQSLAGVPAGQVPAVIAAYRSWYRREGMAMSVVYPGIVELLTGLRNDGVHLAVATQKPEPLAVELLTRHGLAQFFTVMRGAHANESLTAGDPGYRPGKAEIIAAALADTSAIAALEVPAGTVPTAIMVGDRYQDVEGAASNGLQCLGVSWGFAATGELAAAGAAAVVDSPEKLAHALTQGPAGEATHGTV